MRNLIEMVCLGQRIGESGVDIEQHSVSANWSALTLPRHMHNAVKQVGTLGTLGTEVQPVGLYSIVTVQRGSETFLASGGSCASSNTEEAGHA